MSSAYDSISPNNNNNNRRINELLSKIGTKSKPLMNKLKFTKSKSEEFLDIIERKLTSILENISLDNIVKKINNLESTFSKFKDFSDKIKNKEDQSLKQRYFSTYQTFILMYPNFSVQILRLSNQVTDSIKLKELLVLQKKLIEQFKINFGIKNGNNYLTHMLQIQTLIDKKIKSTVNNNKPIMMYQERIRKYNNN